MPVDLLRSEQDRLVTETAQAERHLEVAAAEASFGDIAETLNRALDLLADCQRAYLTARGPFTAISGIKALSERLVIYDDASPRPRLPIPSFPSGWMVRPPREPALCLAAVQMRSSYRGGRI